jgi:hypothetical protein
MGAIGIAYNTVLSAGALEACPTPEALTGQPVTFEQMYEAREEAQVVKGEFETTAHFEARKSSIQPPQPSLLAFNIKGEMFKYDADNQTYSLNSIHLDASPLMFKYSLRAGTDKNLYGESGNHSPIAAIFGRKTISESQEEAQNGYGAKFVVTNVIESKDIVFERPGGEGINSIYDTIFTDRKSNSKEIGDELIFYVPLEIAPSFKNAMTAVAWAEPKAPYFDEQRYYSSATTSNPTSRLTNYRILHADIVCVGVQGPEGQLLGSWKVR